MQLGPPFQKVADPWSNVQSFFTCIQSLQFSFCRRKFQEGRYSAKESYTLTAEAVANAENAESNRRQRLKYKLQRTVCELFQPIYTHFPRESVYKRCFPSSTLS